MEPKRTFSGTGTEDVWQQIDDEFASGVSVSDYQAAIDLNGLPIELRIVSSPGGSEEGGYDTTRLSSHYNGHRGFHFAIHPEDFLYKIGKMFGMEDVTTGYPEFDKNVIVKTNDPRFFKEIFADEEVRQVFQTLSGYSFKIVPHDEKQGDHLELYILRGIQNAEELRPIFNAFCHVATALNKQ